MKSNPPPLGRLQLRIMKILWREGEAPVADVHKALNDGLAYTTVATMLRKMEARGLVSHRSEGRRFIYKPKLQLEDVTRSMAHDVLDRVFEGSLADMVSHLLSTRNISPSELKKLEKLLAERRES